MADKQDQPLTEDFAVHSGGPWSADEDAVVIARLRDPARDVALELGRTPWSVRDRRRRLREAGIIPPVARHPRRR